MKLRGISGFRTRADHAQDNFCSMRKEFGESDDLRVTIAPLLPTGMPEGKKHSSVPSERICSLCEDKLVRGAVGLVPPDGEAY